MDSRDGARLIFRIEVIWSEAGRLWADGWAYWEKDEAGYPKSADVRVRSLRKDPPRQQILRVARADQPVLPSPEGTPLKSGFHLVWDPDGEDTYRIEILSPAGEVAESMQVSRRQLQREEKEREKLAAPPSDAEKTDYAGYLERQRMSKEEKRRQQKESKKESLSFLLKVHLTGLSSGRLSKAQRAMLQSIRSQTYRNWRLLLLPEKGKRLRDPYLTGLSLLDHRILREAERDMEGDIYFPVGDEDRLEADALYRLAKAFKDEGVDAVYLDEDEIAEMGIRMENPKFKPDFNLELLRSENYIGHTLAVRRDRHYEKKRKAAQKEGPDVSNGAGSPFDSTDYDKSDKRILNAYETEDIYEIENIYEIEDIYETALILSEAGASFGHIPRILYHAAKRREDIGRSLKALSDHLARLKIDATPKVRTTAGSGGFWFPYPRQKKEKISIIIPNHNQKDILQKCIRSIHEHAGNVDFEILIVENNSTEEDIFRYYEELEQNPSIRILVRNQPFNYSALNNLAAAQAKGSLLLFLNNDIELLTDGGLEMLSACCQRPGAGAAGARLLYPDGRIQHAGVIVGMLGTAGHAFSHLGREEPGYMNRAVLRQELSAVTGACLMVRREVFQRIGGFDEELAVDFNDVDLCLRIRRAGYRILYESGMEAIHHESLSRNEAPTLTGHARFRREVQIFQKRWKRFLDKGDPAYNPNLTLTRTDYSIKE